MADVVLDKQPDGSWGPQAPYKRRSNSWQRLWFVTGCIYLLMLIGTCYLVVPTRERVERRMVSAVVEEVRRFDGMAFAGESPDAIYRRARSDGFSVWISRLRSGYRIGIEGDAGFNRIDRDYRESISSLPTKHVIAFLLCGAAWVIPMGVLYVIGFSVDWIKRGVRIQRQ